MRTESLEWPAGSGIGRAAEADRTTSGGSPVIGVPVVSGRADAAASDRSAHAPAASTVLVIDDEPAVREATTDLLESWGYVVLAAGSGHEAMRVLATAACVPDFVISDYRLCLNERGDEVIARVRERCQHPVPAVIVTGSHLTGSALGTCTVPVLGKPVDPGRLRALLERGCR